MISLLVYMGEKHLYFFTLNFFNKYGLICRTVTVCTAEVVFMSMRYLTLRL